MSSLFALINGAPAFAANVIATGTSPAVCDQAVNNSTGVTSVRLAGGDCVVTFSDTSVAYSWTAPAGLYSVSYLIIGGGGGGGSSWDNAGSGGGGGGQYRYGTLSISSGGTYSLAVGKGGAGGPADRSATNGGTGGTTTFASVSALGGGGGTYRSNNGALGNGAGGTAQSTNAAALGGMAGDGGYSGGGGGGAGGGGSVKNGSSGGAGGNGMASSQSGTSVTYSAGGAGGGISVTANGANGANGTGNGGVGASATSGNAAAGGSGGSGVIILRYSTAGPAVNTFELAGSPNRATYQQSTIINLNVTLASTVIFMANNKRIAGCISVPTTGSGSSHSVSCSWLPSVKGAVSITALIKPTAAYLSSTTSTISISVVARTNKR